MSTIALLGAADSHCSVFAGADVCHEAGLTLPDGVRRPVFDDDFWDFSEVIGLPNQMAMVSRRFSFAVIIDTRWQLVAKEQIMAMLAPRHEAVAPLPRAGLGGVPQLPAGHHARLPGRPGTDRVLRPRRCQTHPG